MVREGLTDQTTLKPDLNEGTRKKQQIPKPETVSETKQEKRREEALWDTPACEVKATRRVL